MADPQDDQAKERVLLYVTGDDGKRKEWRQKARDAGMFFEDYIALVLDCASVGHVVTLKHQTQLRGNNVASQPKSSRLRR